MKIVADAWKIHQGRYAQVMEQLLGTNPGKLKDLRTMRRTGSENNLTACLDGMGGVVAP